MKHSELPFNSENDIEAEEGMYGILSSDGDKYIAAEVTDEDAAFIVKACNNHYPLVEIVKQIADDNLNQAYLIAIAKKAVEEL